MSESLATANSHPPFPADPTKLRVSFEGLGCRVEGVMEMGQFSQRLPFICEKSESLMDTEASVDFHCDGQLAAKGKMLMEKLDCWATFYTQCQSHRHKEMCMQAKNFIIYNQETQQKSPQKFYRFEVIGSNVLT